MALKQLRKFSDVYRSLKADVDTFLSIEEPYSRESLVDDLEATVRLKCTWNKRHNIMAAFKGHLRTDGSVELPVYYDLLDVSSGTYAGQNTAFAICRGIHCEGFAGLKDSTTSTNYRPVYATMELEFMPAEWLVFSSGSVHQLPTIATKPICITEHMEQSTEFLTLPGEKLYWGRGEELVKNSSDTPTIRKAIDTFTWTVTRHFVTESELTSSTFASDELSTFVNSVNKQTYTSIQYQQTFLPESLRFQCHNVRPMEGMGGKLFAVTFVLNWKPTPPVPQVGAIPAGWNVFPRAGYEEPFPISFKLGENEFDYYRPYPIKNWGSWLPNGVAS